MAQAGTRRILVLSDLHAPYQDERALKVVEAFQRDFKPHITIGLGDWIDGSAVSSFAKDVGETDQLHEFEVANSLLDRFRPKVFLEGNHEQRFRRKGNIPQDLRRLLDPRRWLNLEKRRILWVPYSHFDKDIYRLGKLSFIHGFACTQYSSTREALRFGNVVHGHTHRVQMCSIPHVNTRCTGYNIGCLCDLNQEYVQTRSPHAWEHAFGYGFIRKSGDFTFNIVQISGERVSIEGREYSI